MGTAKAAVCWDRFMMMPLNVLIAVLPLTDRKNGHTGLATDEARTTLAFMMSRHAHPVVTGAPSSYNNNT